MLGWAVTTSVWTSPAKALAPASKSYANLPGLVSLLLTYLSCWRSCSWEQRRSARRQALRARVSPSYFRVSYACWFLGSWAYIAATPDKRAALQIGWSLNLTNESGFIVALLAGLFVGNFMPGAVDLDERSHPAGALHQDGHRDPGRISGNHRARAARRWPLP